MKLVSSSKFLFPFLLLLIWFPLDENTNEPWEVNEGEIPSSRLFKSYHVSAAAAAAATNVHGYFIYRNDPFALLSGTLRTYQKAACDEEWMILRCPTGTTMSIQLAQYGKVAPSPALCMSPSSTIPELLDLADPRSNVTCLWPTAIQTVVGLCQKKASCKFQTSPRTFGGDPCPGSRKYVEVAYKCRPSEFKSVIGCENEVIQLKCNRSSRLAIYSANFGRTEYESIQCPQPKGVHEETCLSSYATETVMQMCHGKRKCALGVDPATFGNPCKPQSLMYLKVIHTCVPRKVLKEKYQGEPEPDELFEDEHEEEGTDPVLEQPSIYDPDHSKGTIWASSRPKTTPKPIQTSLNQIPGSRTGGGGKVVEERRGNSDRVKTQAESAAVLLHGKGSFDPRNTRQDDEEDVTGESIREMSSDDSDTPLVSVISQGIQAYDFISKNPEKFYLYVAISIASGLLMLVILLLLKIWIQRNRGLCAGEVENNRGCGSGKCTSSKPSSSSVGPLTSGISDIDELSLVMDPSSSEMVDLHSILRRSTPAEELFPLASPTCTNSERNSMSATTTLGRSNEVVRFSNNVIRHPDESDMNPRSLNPNRSSGNNIHFYYG